MTAYDLPLYRSWFPHLTSGKIWMNHAAISPLSIRVNEAIERYLEARTSGDIDVFFTLQQTVARTRENLGVIVNSTPDRIAFVPNTSEGLNILASGLTWHAGDRIILNDSEFPANVVPFLYLRRHGVEIDFVRTDHGPVTAEAIERLMTPRTRLVSISFVQFLSGFRADLVRIGNLCKRRNVIFCVDAIQGLGVSPLDVQAMGIDFLSCGTSKWLMGLMGLGFVFLTEAMQERVQQWGAGWMSNKDFFSDFFRYRIDLDNSARRYENATQNLLAIVALHASTSVLLQVKISNIQRHLFGITNALIDAVDSLGYALITPRERESRAGIVTFRCSDANDLFQALRKRNIHIAVRERMIRVSPHFYTSQDDVGAFHSALLEYKKTKAA